ncbi:MAG: HPF/RaiA family ribosome-associated protein [Pseudobdellovibrionaceae bacterium]
MIQVKFKNLEKSELAREAVHDRIETLIEKFPDLGQSKIQVILEMQNSPAQAGPDVFKVKVHVANGSSNGRYSGITIEKASPNLYVALANVVDHMLETLNRFGDRARVKERRNARQIAQELVQSSQIREENFG